MPKQAQQSSFDSLCAESIPLSSHSLKADLDLYEEEKSCFSDEEEEEEEKVEAPPADMRSIIMKQKASGSWSLADVGSLLGSLSADKIKKALAALVTRYIIYLIFFFKIIYLIFFFKFIIYIFVFLYQWC